MKDKELVSPNFESRTDFSCRFKPETGRMEVEYPKNHYPVIDYLHNKELFKEEIRMFHDLLLFGKCKQERKCEIAENGIVFMEHGREYQKDDVMEIIDGVIHLKMRIPDGFVLKVENGIAKIIDGKI